MEEIIKPQVKVLEEDQRRGRFLLDPLYPGYGMTVGTALRRVLLSSLPGAAIDRIKIDGVSHEFSTLPGMREDVVELSLNLKALRLKLHGDEPVTLKLTAKGAKEIRAKDISAPSQVELVDPDHYIATLDSEGSELRMELIAVPGRGYVPVELKPERPEIGVIMLDSIFSPVRKVNIKVENTRVGQRTDFNKLEIEIETDGTMTPSEALREASKILVGQLSVAQEFEGLTSAQAGPRQAKRQVSTESKQKAAGKPEGEKRGTKRK